MSEDAIVRLAASNEPSVSVMADMLVSSLCGRDYGTLIDYSEFLDLLHLDPQSRRGRAVILRAAKRLLSEERKLLVNVRGKGYRIVQPNEHAGESRRFQQSSRRRLRKAVAAVVHVALDSLTPVERQEVLCEQIRCQLKLGLDRRLSRAKELPERKQVQIPSGRGLVALLTKKVS